MSRWKSNRKLSETTIELPTIEVEKTVEKDVMFSPMSGNKIYFYSDVTRESIYNLNRQIDEVTKHLKSIQFSYNLPEPPAIDLYISSEGGDVFPAMASVDKILNNIVPIHTHVEGIAASAATLLSVVGKVRTTTENSMMLVHQIQAGFWGNYQEFKDELRNQELIMKLISNIYLRYTKFQNSDLEEMLKHDFVLDAAECVKFGLVDSIC
jgi:ATP-dependent Clp protease, protease subunit